MQVQQSKPVVSPGDSDEGLLRALGLGSAILLVVGNVIGSGIFLTTGGMAAVIPSASLLLLAWVLGGLFAVGAVLALAPLDHPTLWFSLLIAADLCLGARDRSQRQTKSSQ